MASEEIGCRTHVSLRGDLSMCVCDCSVWGHSNPTGDAVPCTIVTFNVYCKPLSPSCVLFPWRSTVARTRASFKALFMTILSPASTRHRSPPEAHFCLVTFYRNKIRLLALICFQKLNDVLNTSRRAGKFRLCHTTTMCVWERKRECEHHSNCR